MRRFVLPGLVTAMLATLLAPVTAARPFSPSGGSGGQQTYLVLYAAGVPAAVARAAIRAAGGSLIEENPWVGLATVRGADPGFPRAAGRQAALEGVAHDRAIGWAPPPASPASGRLDGVDAGWSEAAAPATATATTRGRAAGRQAGRGGTGRALHALPVGPEPLSALQWDMRMIGATADGSYRVNRGNKGVLVGVIDTGIDGSHPDIAPNFDHALSRTFTRDIPAVDGPCEHPSCVDPPDEDDEGHGTHVAGIVAGALNGLGIAGVAPGVTLVSLRAGQDSGLFFLQPVVDALTYAALVGIDVVNLSFYIDPWLYNCPRNPADTPDEQAEQRIIVEATQRAIDFARALGVTPVAALGNEHTDLDLLRAGPAGGPVTDDSSPDYPPRSARHRVIDGSCRTVPAQIRGVIAVSALGPDGRTASYSNWGLDDTAVAAPGGDLEPADGERPMRPEDAVLSAYPANVAWAHHDLRADSTPASPFVLRDCEHGTCAYYQYLQGTSMAAPHVAGVAALIVSALGHPDPVHGGLTLDPATVERVLQQTATPTACPAPVISEGGHGAAGGTSCRGTRRFNSVYGHGVVNALRAARAQPPEDQYHHRRHLGGVRVLVGPAVFKTVAAGIPRRAGSIPVHLR